jgi:hypothetical protein
MSQNYEVLTDNSVETLAWRPLHFHVLYSLNQAKRLRRPELDTSGGMQNSNSIDPHGEVGLAGLPVQQIDGYVSLEYCGTCRVTACRTVEYLLCG